ncbi:MAG: helicase-related protein [Alphaproteobacteria bacterium]
MLAHESGMIGLPLRLLAREIYDRICGLRSESAVALVTGEEKIIPESPSYWVCTVEAMPLDKRVAFLAVDEIQLASDPERGHTFTSRLLHARGQLETLFLGAATMRGALRELLPGIQFMQRSRLSQLSYAGERKVSRLPRRSAVVAFSADQVYSAADLIRRQRGGAAVVMGALSPRTRNAQVALYQSGDVDFIVATDAIGMGLNMDIDHVAFAARRKFDGHGYRDLKANELAQIAGRAGRYMNDGTFGVTGECPPFDAELVDAIENHRFDPVRLLHWRNDDIDFSSIDAMISSLDIAPSSRGLLRAKAATDLVSLKQMGANLEVVNRSPSEAHRRLLWTVCQIPDFQQTFIDDHVRLLTNIFVHLVDNGSKLPEDWLAGHIERLNITEGDIDTLQARLAFIRTWTYVSNRETWLEKPEHWQGRTQEIEDNLSDALHERLTQRFIDRRTSVLMRKLSEEDFIDVIVDEDGEVSIEGEFIGRLAGLRFVLDPRATESKSALEARALRGAATKALEPFIYRVAARLRAARKEDVSLKDQGVIVFEGHPIARLKPGRSPLKPRVELVASEMISDLLGADGRQGILMLLEAWVDLTITETLPGLVQLKKAHDEEVGEVGDGPIPLGAERKPALNGLARGIGFQLLENFGVLARASVAEQIKALTPEDRAQLRALGVRFGEFSIYLPNLLKPAQARLLVLLWGVHSGLALTPEGVPSPPPPGLTSAPLDPAWSDAFLAAAGYRRIANRAVRVDILERIGNLIRKQRFPEPPKPATKSPIVVNLSAPSSEAAAAAPATTEAAEASSEGTEAQVEAADVETADAPTADAPVAEAPNAETAGAEAAPAAEGAATQAVTAEPQAAPAAPAKPAFKPRPGSFQVVPEMLSLAGCSATDFEEVLKGLGYRKITIKEDNVDHVIWRAARPQDEQREDRRGGKRNEQQQRHGKPGARAGQNQGRDRHERRYGRDNKDGAQAANAAKAGAAPNAQPTEQRQGGDNRGRHQQQGKPHQGGGGGKHQHRNDRPHHQRPREPVYDKDSPFAVLAQLKGQLKPK